MHQAALLVGGLVLVNDALGGGHVDALDGGSQNRLFVLGSYGRNGVLGARAQFGLDGLVALAVDHVLLVALNLTLNIRHENPRYQCAETVRRAA